MRLTNAMTGKCLALENGASASNFKGKVVTEFGHFRTVSDSVLRIEQQICGNLGFIP